ncbi:transcriptional activator Spt7p [[Candida] railenensis]|uniref:SAGA complex subunit Spt7 n=1 Tax=[Candida] railenensis TaxID=45579 RepID=A0A9P0VY35_9ASCO|nr:transcriptional activator Spt7p [[Candida] railenensis]
MDKLSSFQGNNILKLFELAKELSKLKFFETFVTDFQNKILSFILEKDDLKLWRDFIDGNCTLKITRDDVSEVNGEDKEQDSIESTNDNTSNNNDDVEDHDDEEDDEEAFDEGYEPLQSLALHVRYLLWEKAIDFYYSCKELDNSVNDIEEVSDDYELIDRIDREVEDGDGSKKAGENEENKAEEVVKVRNEEDDYDDDDDEDEEEKGQDTKDNDSKVDNMEEEYERNEENRIILTIPISVLKDKSKSDVPESTAINGISTEPNTEGSKDLNGSNAAIATDAADASASTSPTTDQSLIKEFNKIYHNFEYDRETLMKRRKLEKSDKQLEESSSEQDTNQNGTGGTGASTSTAGGISTKEQQQLGINLGSASHSLKHLLKAISHQRDEIDLNDFELRSLFMDVRKNRGKWASDERVGQEELYEACEKVVMDLRGYTEHSTPFLNKVSKREAPNYGLIIKKPMDLNTVMKKLKGLQYQSKQSFVDDLNLIWNNCLTYNADPKHFLRAHAIAMQKRTNKLVPSIPNITIRSRAEVEKEEELEEKNEAAAAAATTEGGAGKATQKGRKRTKADADEVENNDDNSKEENDRDENKIKEEKDDESTKIKEENGTASDDIDIEMADASTITNGTVGGGGGEDDDEEEDDVDVNVAGDLDEEEVDLELQAWRSMTAKSRANYCAKRSELFTDSFSLNPNAEAMTRESYEMNNFKHYLSNDQVVSKSSNLLESDEPYLLEYDVMGGLPGLVYSGLDSESELKREQKLVDLYLQQSGGDVNNIKSDFVLPLDSGLNKVYHDIIGKIQDIRKICFKISLIRQMQTQQFVHHTQMKQPEVEDIKEVDIDPVSKLSNHEPFSSEVQYGVLRRAVSKIAMQTGFESTEPFAINALTQVAEKYYGNLVKTLKMHLETNSTNRLTYKEALLATLLENGINKPDDLYTFVQERIVKQYDKLKDLKIKLSNFLKELLRPGLENFNEKSFADNSEQFMTGDFSSDLGDDFFGFKELGLDKEFKMLSGAIPIYLLHSRLHNNYAATGSVNKKNKYEDLKELKDPKIYASEITQQIGILRPFYYKLLEKTKTQYIKSRKKKGESTELPPDDKFLLIEDEELPQKQRNIRPRLPPTGKIVSVKKRTLANGFYLPDEE